MDYATPVTNNSQFDNFVGDLTSRTYRQYRKERCLLHFKFLKCAIDLDWKF
jgi:hypothetical protein